MIVPHCDPRILHAPGECFHCDKHPSLQNLRVRWGIAFTGHPPKTEGWVRQLPCPADHNRPAGAPNDHRRWSGNRSAADTRGALSAVLESIDEYSKALPASASAVHAFPRVSSTDRMHDIDVDCWCGPIVITAEAAIADGSAVVCHVSAQVDEATLAAAFTEWDRRYREEPDRFESEASRLLKSTPETYGEAAAPYLLAILAEQKNGQRNP